MLRAAIPARSIDRRVAVAIWIAQGVAHMRSKHEIEDCACKLS
nr:hypothetical protein 3.4 [Burkholderia phage Bups phi1]